MLYCILYAFVVDSETVDYGLVSRDSEAAWLRISVLWLWSEGSDLYETESKVCHVIIEFSVLVESSCETDRIREFDSKYFLFKGR